MTLWVEIAIADFDRMKKVKPSHTAIIPLPAV
jgi:hypothetical protein